MEQSSPSPNAGRVCLGVIVGTHGIRGAVKIKAFTTRPEDVAGFGPLSDESGRQAFVATWVGFSGAAAVCTVEGVRSREAAERLKGVRLYVERKALPPLDEEDAFYHADLIGLTATFADGTQAGKVCAVYDFGAGDVLELAGPTGVLTMIPFTKEAVPLVDVPGGRLVVARIPGLLEEEIAPKTAPKRERRNRGERPKENAQ